MSMIVLAPDPYDVAEVMAPTLKRCPFCESRPITFSRVNEERTHWQAHVKCSNRKCEAGIFVNRHTLEEARADARTRWECRVRPAPGASA